jgi:ribonuclease BN (tRNA processing enzyme)
VPFMLVDAMLGARRNRPLTIAGPRDLRARMDGIAEALFPGSQVMVPKFPLDYIEMRVGERSAVGNLRITPYAAKHTWQTNPTCLRVEVGDKVIAYTGDGEWTDAMARMGQGADLVIAECYSHAKPIKWHMNYPTIVEHLRDFGAKRVILTHMSEEMLSHANSAAEECAHDGMVVEL